MSEAAMKCKQRGAVETCGLRAGLSKKMREAYCCQGQKYILDETHSTQDSLSWLLRKHQHPFFAEQLWF